MYINVFRHFTMDRNAQIKQVLVRKSIVLKRVQVTYVHKSIFNRFSVDYPFIIIYIPEVEFYL